jgi:hypothetical protein
MIELKIFATIVVFGSIALYFLNKADKSRRSNKHNKSY